MKNLFICIFLISTTVNLQSQKVNSYTIDVEFFPDDARIFNNPVSPDAFMRANTLVEFSEVTSREIIFYLHSELE